MLIIADSTKNSYIHNRTEGFPSGTWLCRVIRSVNSTVCKGPVKLIKRVKIAHSFLQSVSDQFHVIILSLPM